jgi:hypothetical protein
MTGKITQPTMINFQFNLRQIGGKKEGSKDFLELNNFCETTFCTPDDALSRNIMSFHIQILSQFVKPPSDTLLRYPEND